MRRSVWGSAVALFLALASGQLRAEGPLIFDAWTAGRVDSVSSAQHTITIIPYKPIGETFQLAQRCAILLDGHRARLSDLRPGYHVYMVYDPFHSVVGKIVAIRIEDLGMRRLRSVW